MGMRRQHAYSLVAALVACATTPAPKPDDMSAEQHREEAAREGAAARQGLDDHAMRSRMWETAAPQHADTRTRDEYGPAGPVVGPRGATPDLYLAHAHAVHARQHEAAALELERFESQECSGIPSGERSACPLLRGAGVVADVAGGIEIRFRDGAPVDDVQRRMRCHFAYARARGFDEADGCALYLKGIEIDRTDARVIRITAGDPQTTARLRTAGHEQVPALR